MNKDMRRFFQDLVKRVLIVMFSIIIVFSVTTIVIEKCRRTNAENIEVMAETETEIEVETKTGIETEAEAETENETEAETKIEVETTVEKTTEVETEVEESTKVEKEAEETNGEGFPQFWSERYLLAQIIYCEAGGVSEEEMAYAGSVVINRARTNYHDFRGVNTIYDVLYQGYGTNNQQYDGRTLAKISNGLEPSSTAIEIANGLLSGKIECLSEDILFQFDPSISMWKGIEEVNLPTDTYGVFCRPTDF